MLYYYSRKSTTSPFLSCFRLLTMFSIFFTHSARKIPAAPTPPRRTPPSTKEEGKRELSIGQESVFQETLFFYGYWPQSVKRRNSQWKNLERSRRRIEAETQSIQGGSASSSTYFEIKALSMIFLTGFSFFLLNKAIMRRKMRRYRLEAARRGCCSDASLINVRWMVLRWPSWAS